MIFNDLIRMRQSVRRYAARPVEREKLEQCLEAARLAPSASNSQPWTFVVVDDPELKEKVARETYSSMVSFNKFAQQAGVLVVIVIEKPRLITQVGSIIKNKEYPLIDIGIAAEHFCLQATELGLGTCMLGWFNQAPIRTLLHIPFSKTIGLVITVGYPDESVIQREKTRKPFSEVVRYNGYRNLDKQK
ncbi:MAG: nitroreductase family protein [Bacteroidales bacterium]|nr:nitroreductase family protein [Bacteroidales bacterium]MDD3665492.1 nitroreductase family protein [Bacteroidales bacterium]